MPDSTFLIAAGSLITVLVGAYVTITKSKVESRVSTVSGEIALSESYRKYSQELEVRLSRQEERIKALEEGVVERQKVYELAIIAKDNEIKELRERIEDLEVELAEYKRNK